MARAEADRATHAEDRRLLARALAHKPKEAVPVLETKAMRELRRLREAPVSRVCLLLYSVFTERALLPLSAFRFDHRRSRSLCVAFLPLHFVRILLTI